MFVASDECTPSPDNAHLERPPPAQLFEHLLLRGFQRLDNVAEEVQSKQYGDILGDVLKYIETAWTKRPAELVNPTDSFMWQAIYPQDESGRPCYNAFGNCYNILPDNFSQLMNTKENTT